MEKMFGIWTTSQVIAGKGTLPRCNDCKKNSGKYVVNGSHVGILLCVKCLLIRINEETQKVTYQIERAEKGLGSIKDDKSKAFVHIMKNNKFNQAISNKEGEIANLKTRLSELVTYLKEFSEWIGENDETSAIDLLENEE